MRVRRWTAASAFAGALLWPGSAIAAGAGPATAPAPAYVPSECRDQLKGPAPSLQAPAADPLTRDSPLSRERQLEVFQRLVEAVTANYVYTDFNGPGWLSEVANARTRINQGMDTAAFYAEMGRLVVALGDAHSYYLSPLEVQESNTELSGKDEFVGIGVLDTGVPERQRITILAVHPESPAEYAGLRPHDSILAVDGRSVAAAGHLDMHSTRGPPCSVVRLTVQAPSQPPRLVSLVRQKFVTYEPVDFRLVPGVGARRIGYLYVPTFFDLTIPAQVRSAVQSLAPLDALIVDVRMNGGGASQVLQALLGTFMSGRAGEFTGRAGMRPLDIGRNPIGASAALPLAVLVDHGTNSFAEVFAATLQDQRRARVVGEATAGHVEVLHRVDLPDGSRAWIAMERFLPEHSRRELRHTGVRPDVEVHAAWDEFTIETDPVVAAAVRLLDGGGTR